MNGLFISYRRDDSAPYAGRLYDFLRSRLPQQHVFMDIDAIEPGEDFVVAIHRTLSSSRVVLAIIGPDWLEARERDGSRRLDNPDDYVVRELQAALESQARVIPVLVGDAAMPRTDNLPEVLRPLARRNAIEISDMRFNYDADRLAGAIERAAGIAAAAVAPAAPAQPAMAAPAQPAAAAPPASTADRPDEGRKLLQLKIAVWVSFVLGLLSALVHIGMMGGGIDAYLVMTLVMAGLMAWTNVALVRGRRWARIAFAVFFGLGVLGLFFGDRSSMEEAVLDLPNAVLCAWALWLVFMPPLKHRYARGGAAAVQRAG